jgi:hypothetical protein
MISPVARSALSNHYALRVLTELAARLKADAGQPARLASILPTSQHNPLLDAAGKIAQILLDAQSIIPALQTPTVTIDPTPPEKRAVGEEVLVIGGEALILRAGTQGASTMFMGPWGSLKMATGPTDDGYATLVPNDKPTTITLASDVDVGFVGGTSEDELISVAGSRNIAHVYGGDGDDTVAVVGAPPSVLGTPKVEYIDGGNGDDFVHVVAASADRITGGAGDDQVYVHIPGYGPASRIDGGEGDDRIHVQSGGIVSDVSGGEGDDKMFVVAGTVRNISGGDGNDTMTVGGNIIERISGGRGDDRITIWNHQGNLATLVLNEGDGHDVVEASGPVRIERFNADGTAQMLDLSSVTVTRGEKGAYIIDFGNGTDSLTIYRQASGREKIALQATPDGALLI